MQASWKCERWAAHLPVALCACVATLTFTSGVKAPALALPPGRSWSAIVDTLKIPGHTYGVAPKRLETDLQGRPLSFVEALGGIGRDMYVLRWQDSTWVSLDHLGYGTKGVRPVPSPDGTYHLVWGGLEEIMTDRLVTYLVMSALVADTLTRPDTVTTFHSLSLRYAAAASPLRRWAAVDDNGDLRLLYSDALGIWHEAPVGEHGDRGMAVATLDDTTALVAWKDLDLGPGAGTLRGSTWTLAGPPPMTGPLDGALLFRMRPSGGYWLSWATQEDFVGVTSYRDGAWSEADSIRCAYLRPGGHYAQSLVHMSRDEGEYPAVSWMAVSALNGLTSVCVCVPDETGFTVAENLPGSEEGLSPVIARDRNHDVWVVWQAPDGMAWTHTYTRATASAPTVTGTGSKRFINWTLSEPAPGSWWAVLRARGEDPYEELARVKAGAVTGMTWTDLSPPAGTLRYRIRRECLDRKYEWLSDEVGWPVDVPALPPGGSLRLVLASPNPSSEAIRLELVDASAGPLDVRVYDLRGRLVLHQTSVATGTGQDSILVNLATAAGGPTPGLYFLRVVDASGQVSPAAKLVLLR